MSIPVFLDMNLGDNVDEAFALALASSSPEIRLIGVSTSYAQSDLLTLATRQMLGAYGRTEIEVAGRSNQPRRMSPQRRYKHFMARLTKRYHGPVAKAANKDAIDFMAERIQAERDVTFLSIAPLTNVAELLRRYPRIRRSLREIVFMGGWPTQALPEWNIMGDPDAASSILNSDIPVRLVGYEATLGCVLPQLYVGQLEASRHPGPRLLAQYYQIWTEVGSTPPIMHDPLTVAMVVRPTLGRFVSERVSVNLQEGPGRGALYLDPTKGRLVDWCAEVDIGDFLDLLIRRISVDSTALVVSHDPSAWSINFAGAYKNSYYKGWEVSERKSAHHMLILTVNGNCEVTIDDKTFTAAPESVIYVPQNHAYSITTKDELEVFWVQFQIYVKDRGTSFVSLGRIPDLPLIVRPKTRFPFLSSHVEQITANWQRSWIEGYLRCQANLLHLLAELLNCVHETDAQTINGSELALSKAKRYIETHLQERVDLDTLCRYVGLSKFHFCRLFKDAYGLPPLKYHLSLRMKRAQTLLKLRHLPLCDIAKQVGYTSVNTFSRAFRKEVGVPPSDFRAEP